MGKTLEDKIRGLVKQLGDERRLGDKRAEQFYDAIKATPDFSTITEPSPVEIVGGDFLLYYDIGTGANKKIELQDLPHGLLDDLDLDHHTQYHNDTRGDARYYTHSQIGAVLDMTWGVTKKSVLFRAYLSANQTNLTAGVWTQVQFDSEVFDLGSDYDTGNCYFVAPVTGRYLFYTCVMLSDLLGSATYEYRVALVKNATTYIMQTRNQVYFDANSKIFSLQVSDICHMSANDTMRVHVYNNWPGGNDYMDIVGTSNDSSFYGYLLTT